MKLEEAIEYVKDKEGIEEGDIQVMEFKDFLDKLISHKFVEMKQIEFQKIFKDILK